MVSLNQSPFGTSQPKQRQREWSALGGDPDLSPTCWPIEEHHTPPSRLLPRQIDPVRPELLYQSSLRLVSQILQQALPRSFRFFCGDVAPGLLNLSRRNGVRTSYEREPAGSARPFPASTTDSGAPADGFDHSLRSLQQLPPVVLHVPTVRSSGLTESGALERIEVAGGSAVAKQMRQTPTYAEAVSWRS